MKEKNANGKQFYEKFSLARNQRMFIKTTMKI